MKFHLKEVLENLYVICKSAKCTCTKKEAPKCEKKAAKPVHKKPALKSPYSDSELDAIIAGLRK